MSFRDHRRYAAITASWNIPDDLRVEGVKRGTAADAAALFSN